MRNFPFNLLSSAQTVIAPQEYQLQSWTGRTRNANGYEIDQYSSAVTRKASIQPMKREHIMQYGLDINKEYIQIFDVQLVKLLSRSQNPDRIIYNGYNWTARPSDNGWYQSSGWNQVIAVRGDRV